jgi:hypothetical protein
VNGITDLGMPFFSPLLWNALIHMNDWDLERSHLEMMMRFPLDCNYIGMCGFNLMHLYIIEALFDPESIKKLEWWINFPMVDVNTFFLNIHEKRNQRVEIQHPLSLIFSLVARYDFCPDRVIHLLIARGISIYNHPLTLPLIHDIPESSPLFSRLCKQWDNDMTFSFNLEKIHQKRKSDAMRFHVLPSPSMNEWHEIPSSHSLSFASNGNTFIFHASYMDTIKKTHIFPFTREYIDMSQIDEWLEQMTMDWFPREEFVTKDMMDRYPTYANTSPHTFSPDQYAIQYLYDWISSFYPYSRIMLLLEFSWKNDYLFEYMCREMSRGAFMFPAFRGISRKENQSWKDLFFWAAYDSLEEGYIFSNRLEELISRLELFLFFQKYLNGPFHLLFSSQRSFQESPEYKKHMDRIQLCRDEYDYSFYQIYHFMKQISMLFNIDNE